jgi:hypothetical protein
MTLEQLVKALEGQDSMFALSSIGIPAIREALLDTSKRLRALEKAAPKK